MQKLTSKREGLFENFTEGILDEDEYRFAKSKYEDQAAELQKKIDEAKGKRDRLEKILSGNSEWLEALHRVEDAKELDQNMVDDLVKEIRIYEDSRIDIELNYSDEKRLYEDILAELSEGAD